MNTDNQTLAESLTPPFVAAIFSDTVIVEHLTECQRRPSDEMVSMAPAQDGFLGLETMRDDLGKWLSVSYWRDMTAYTKWLKVCDTRITTLFPDASLESLCHIRVANVDEPIASQRTRHLTANTPHPISTHTKPRGMRLFNVFPSIAELFSHVHIR